jgi:CMP-N,N'-diacetyllegionaminic acid synthase
MTVNYIKDYIWKISGNKKIAINYDYPNHPRSQDLPENYFQINFGIVIIKIEDYFIYNNLVTPNTKFIPLDKKESIDIDDAVDFKIAENLFKNKAM